ncbi:30S ribosomal protein S11e [Fonticula alba]|uniref:30S ribosomal protein S11e n=1 Tax=Fonticula alba TaxID=691883 RepID=A0A058Z3Z3_FONAL|nr:30S ribosomal protein S11e [Fonticula alba]KCV68861.1 30S ribosomal protein S11e [Fonticula alba]|eukprot:XP_009496432.1 30S ribosomal protein S11e [Fonticula alba]
MRRWSSPPAQAVVSLLCGFEFLIHLPHYPSITMSDVQVEKAFQKQHGISLINIKKYGVKKASSTRFYKNVGLGIRTPTEAIKGNYIDNKCPFTSDVSIRGRILSGVVASTKMNRTITVRRDYLHYVRKYSRYEKRHRMISAHCSPAFRVDEGDIVTVGQCRPLSKTVRFNVIRIDRKATGAQKQFTKF